VSEFLHAGGLNQIRIGASGGERSIFSSNDWKMYANNVITADVNSSHFRYRRKIAITNDAINTEFLSLKLGYTTSIPASSYASEILSSLQGGDTDNNFVIRNTDQSFNSLYTQNIFLYAGLNTNTGGRYGKLVLQHDGTNTRGGVLIGTSTDEPSSKLTITSTTQGVLFPRMTTTQKNAIASPAAGLVVYDTTLNKLCVRTASAWETITSL
jgi:hypothetical protein